MTMSAMPCRRPAFRLPGPPPDGRPDAAERSLRIECARLYYASRWPVAKISNTYGIHRGTVYRWIARVLDYDDPESLEVQAIAARSHRRVRARSS